MTGFMNLARLRRSVRSYLPDPVPHELIDQCIEAVRYAPSACDRQAWRFIVVEGELKDRIAGECLGAMPVPNRWAAQAPVIVALCIDRDFITYRLGAGMRGIGYALIDAGIAGQHFVLQAAEIGLGTCWIGWFRKRRLKRLLGIPRGWETAALITLGFPAAGAPERERRPLAEIREYRS